MAQMNVPAEPSYKTTTYNGLKGADFSNDPSLVAKNHSPDLVNMISDNGGSPIKRKGWEVVGEAEGEVVGVWHFQMFEKVWHLVGYKVEGTPTSIRFYQLNDDGTLPATPLRTVNVPDDANPFGLFFNSSDPSKTGFYIYHGSDISFFYAASSSATTLTATAMTATIPLVRELTNHRGEGGITYGINLLTREMTFRFRDTRTDMNSRYYYCFPQDSGSTILDIENVRIMASDGDWHTLDNSSTGQTYNVVSGKEYIARVDTTTYVPTADTTENNVEITIRAEVLNPPNANSRKITGCTCGTVYSQMAAGQVFVSGNPDYPQYVWYSELNDPCYFPDINYLFVGGAGTKVTGMIPFNSQIAVFKEPSVTESTIFMLNYSTATDQKVAIDGTASTETRDVYQVKHGFTGVGSLSSKSVASLSDEPLFLSQNGIMGIVSNAINSSNAVKNRSGFLDPKLLKEENLRNAIATVHKNYYILVVNDHAYILDARQKTNDFRGNTSYMYESYYWENIPATCIASDGTTLWFGTADGRLCRFKNTEEMTDYSDNTRAGDDPIRVYPKEGATELSSTWFVDSNGDDVTPSISDKYILFEDTDNYDKYTVFSYSSGAYHEEYAVDVIPAVWSTPLDNDGMTQYYKTLQKKGSGCTVYPYARSMVTAYLEKDGLPLVKVGDYYADIMNWEHIDFARFTFIGGRAPRDDFFKKKMKKYKRLKIILVNDQLNEGFGVMEIFKTYLVTRYAKK